MKTPVITKMEVYPVAGRDCMELNLSGAHAPYFTRNIVILTDSTGTEGVGEVPGGQKITSALESVKDLVVGTAIGDYKATLNKVRAWLNANIKEDVYKRQVRIHPLPPKIPDVKTSGIFLLQNLRLCKNQSLGKRKNTDFGGDVKEKETRELKEF